MPFSSTDKCIVGVKALLDPKISQQVGGGTRDEMALRRAMDKKSLRALKKALLTAESFPQRCGRALCLLWGN